ncbi:hypothetical protein EMIHUDRAFT_236498 [Emiliania huxleyi CCMP1516]|uniref:Secreted protein n=2 Tax=Emiliania huxleyi TaxID=2903 RepID=A0A0D3JTH9_EMIH1|nr:hypothetical protein EMIHUDRAFT_236498 [Emiliania huxleyi CCMP1516]EOD26814.1 hypothetical protein EMIHUDRAFT_236498 [Emiliania huxleyi CCMP1516]|eukprot:XP_005779243.1 hypothetical protein EMIHUDRAFT_236498 [Emiliania huxleyi CCMP1516]
MSGRCLCCTVLLWHASRVTAATGRRLGASARLGAAIAGQRNSPGLNAQPGAPARAGASHGACNAQQCSPRLAQMRPPSQPTVHRLLKKHCDECGTAATHGRLSLYNKLYSKIALYLYNARTLQLYFTALSLYILYRLHPPSALCPPTKAH